MPITASLSTSEPLSARAGDSWSWVRDLADYPAPGWSLIYTLFGPSGVLRITTAADGARHRVAVRPAASGAYHPGRYDWVAHVTDGTDRYQVAAGSLQILPDVRTTTALDGRSHARRMLDAIEAVLENRAADGDLDLVRSQLGERLVEWDPAAMAAIHRRYAALVAAEEAATLAARGGRPGQVQVVFR